MDIQESISQLEKVSENTKPSFLISGCIVYSSNTASICKSSLVHRSILSL